MENTKRTYDLLKAKWEFLRRNADYIEKWNEALYLRKKYQYAPTGEKFHDCMPFPIQALMDSYPYGEDQKERHLCELFDLNSLYLPNPEMSFDELIGVPDGIECLIVKGTLEDKNRNKYSLNAATEILARYPIKLRNQPWNEAPPWGRLTIEVDFTQTNSFKLLKETVEKAMRMFYDQYMKGSQEESGSGRKQKYSIDYNLLLQVGDLHEKQNMTHTQIAKKLFPRDFVDGFAEDSSTANPESAIRKVSHYYKSYRELVNGGYKDIKPI